MDPLIFAALALVAAAARLRPRHRRRCGPDGAAPPRLGGAIEALARRRQRRRTPSARTVAAWCDDIARRLRSGSSLREAITTVPADGTTARATAGLRLAIDRGAPIADAVGRVDDAGPHLRLALGIIATTSRVGGPSAASIDRTAMLLRQRASDHDERTAQATQARLSAHVMTAVPLLMLALLLATDDDVRSVAVAPVGAACIGSGLALNAAGWWWMRRLIGTPS